MPVFVRKSVVIVLDMKGGAFLFHEPYRKQKKAKVGIFEDQQAKGTVIKS